MDAPPEHLIALALEAAVKSPCSSKRGVVIWDLNDTNLTYWTGYNGPPPGFICQGNCGESCTVKAVHAEMDALTSAGRSAYGSQMLHVKAVEGVLVPSGPPSCIQCSKHMVLAHVKTMWLYHETGWRAYRIADFHRISLWYHDIH